MLLSQSPFLVRLLLWSIAKLLFVFRVEPKRMPYGVTSILKDVDGNCLVLSSK